jgi:hypothetical protein
MFYNYQYGLYSQISPLMAKIEIGIKRGIDFGRE